MAPSAEAVPTPIEERPEGERAGERSGERSGSVDVRRLDERRRVTYFMLLRVVVTTLLLGVSVFTEWAQPTTVASPAMTPIFALLATTYGLTLLWAALLARTRSPTRLAVAQATTDVLLVGFVIHLSGGAESGFVFLYLLILVGASTALPRRGLILVAAAISTSYLALSLLERAGLLPPWPGLPPLEGPIAPVARTLAMNLVAFAATAALARRLAVELERAGERIAVERTRREDLAVLHADLVRSLTSGLVTVNDVGRIVTCNAAAAEILGTPSERLIGRPLGEVMPQLAGAAQLRRAELQHVRPDGSHRLLGVSLSPLFTAAGATVGRVVNFSDLTELERMRERIVRAERLAAIGRLATGVAHEIRNPLAAISGAIELLVASPPRAGSDGERAELTEIVTREIDRLNRLITELLRFARPPSLEPVPIELGAALREFQTVCERDQRLALAGRITVTVDGPLWIDADAGMLRQALWNLVTNAAQADPTGRIELHARALDEPVADAGAEPRRFALVAVRDHGPGFSPAVRDRLFEPFFSTKPGGTGLGLATVHRIVEEHRGRIEASAPDGGGAELRTLWPRRDPPAAT